ncbi:hypothetical protein DKX38_014487 [Salix brachista]|uniref:Uncharacterized protein n=4 Tax=Salix TaxID=40685 RepID=A0A5N5LFF4_9ROSI|nr:hypothetical protein DKX38_014487 [Salix brachista]
MPREMANKSYPQAGSLVLFRKESPMAPPPGPYSGTSTLALVARVSAFSFGLVYGSVKLKYLQAKAKSQKKSEAKAKDHH